MMDGLVRMQLATRYASGSTSWEVPDLVPVRPKNRNPDAAHRTAGFHARATRDGRFASPSAAACNAVRLISRPHGV